MRCPSILPDEPERLRALALYGLNSESPLPSLDPVVQIAAHAFNAPAAAVNMIGRDEVFFAASSGMGECDMRRDVSFCAHAITQDEVMVVEDARLDARFHDNPLVTGPAQLRFYAGVPVRSPDGYALGALCVIDSQPRAVFSDHDKAQLKELAKLVTDRLELRRLEVAGRTGAAKFERIAENSPNGIICFDEDGAITAINPAAAAIFDRSPQQTLGAPLELLLPAWKQSQIARLMNQRFPPHGPTAEMREDVVGRREDGTEFPLEVAWSAWLEGEAPNYGLVVRDLTEQRRLEDDLHRMANYDQATGLPNRNLAEARLRENLAAFRPIALVALGISGLPDVNHTLGKDAGDQMLQQIAGRLNSCIRPTDILGSVSPGEFVILLPGITDPLRTADVASAAMAAVAQPISVKGHELRVGASCGIALSPSHGRDADELIGNANLALHEAKKQGPGNFYLFVHALRAQAVARRMFEAELHQAVERNELELYYQPQVRLADGAVTGAEALLRWNHPERGLLPPASFLPALEASSLAAIVGSWVIDGACRQAAKWHAIDASFRMSINLFDAQFRTGDLRAAVAAVLKQYDLPSEAIELEITETTVVDEEALFLPLLQGLRQDGIKLAFDDFGTGYASLSLLSRFPLTHLKIDKSFVREAIASAQDRTIVRAITELAHRLGLQVIAEGVETQEQLEFCKEIACDEVQGYLVGKPMSADHFGRSWRMGAFSLLAVKRRGSFRDVTAMLRYPSPSA